MNLETITNIIKEETNINILENTRQREFIELRSVANKYMKEELDYTQQQIADAYIRLGKKIKRLSIRHSINNYEVYSKYNNKLNKIYNRVLLHNAKKANVIKFIKNLNEDEIEKVNNFINLEMAF
jgi:vacuolar-type H+-ATPase catalytic subunit A/Vma1